MEKIIQTKRAIKLTEAEKKIIAQYSAYNINNVNKPLYTANVHKKIVK